jgi:hypothetical protein
VVLTDRDRAEANAAEAPQTTGRLWPDGRPRTDPAHGGPLTGATFAELIGRLINDVSELADKQIELAKQEVNEAKDHTLSAVKRLAIGAGIAAAVGLLLVIWAWTAFIWFFNWLGALIWNPWGGSLGWILGLLVPALAGWFIAYQRFIKGGVGQMRTIWPPLPRTRATLKEDLEWVRQQRTRSAR